MPAIPAVGVQDRGRRAAFAGAGRDDEGACRCRAGGDAGGRGVGLIRCPDRCVVGHGRPSGGRRGVDDRWSVYGGQGADRWVHRDRGRGPRRGPRVGSQGFRRLRLARRGPGFPRGSSCVRVDPDELAAVYRREVGRCTATLVRVLGDIDQAEDAVAEALALAAERWTVEGVPPNPEGWITTTSTVSAASRRGVPLSGNNDPPRPGSRSRTPGATWAISTRPVNSSSKRSCTSRRCRGRAVGRVDRRPRSMVGQLYCGWQTDTGLDQRSRPAFPERRCFWTRIFPYH